MTTDGPSQRRPWWALDAKSVLVIALFVALFAMAARETADPDLWWHLSTGRYIAETGRIPRQDVFSYTVPDHRWITHEWLAERMSFGLYRLGGLPLLLLGTSALVTATFGLVYLQCEARPHAAVFLVLLGALVSAVTWGPRPQMWTMAGLALWGLLLDRWRSGRRWVLWLYPLTTALWVNLHSGFLLGLAYLGAAIAGELAAHVFHHKTPRTLSLRQVRDLGLALGASVGAALLNPNGAKILTYPFETLGSQAMQRYIQEWASPDFHRPAYWPLALLLIGGAAVSALSRRKRSLTDVGLFCGFGLAALHAARHVPLFAVVAVPIVTRYLGPPSVPRRPRSDVQTTGGRQEDAPPQSPSDRPRSAAGGRLWIVLNWLLVVLLLAGGAARVVRVLAQNRDVKARHYPVAALAYLEAQGLSAARIYNSYNWGGYLTWRRIPVYIDGRADVYGDAFMDQYVRAFQVRGDWRAPLDDYDVEVVLIERESSLATLLHESVEWARVYQDDLAVVFVRAGQGVASPSPNGSGQDGCAGASKGGASLR